MSYPNYGSYLNKRVNKLNCCCPPGSGGGGSGTGSITIAIPIP